MHVSDASVQFCGKNVSLYFSSSRNSSSRFPELDSTVFEFVGHLKRPARFSGVSLPQHSMGLRSPMLATSNSPADVVGDGGLWRRAQQACHVRGCCWRLPRKTSDPRGLPGHAAVSGHSQAKGPDPVPGQHAAAAPRPAPHHPRRSAGAYPARVARVLLPLQRITHSLAPVQPSFIQRASVTRPHSPPPPDLRRTYGCPRAPHKPRGSSRSSAWFRSTSRSSSRTRS